MDYIIENYSGLVFTSDLHFFHKNIFNFTSRDTNIIEHNDWVINKCNSKIKNDSIVYHLGDMFFKCTNEEAVEVMKKLNGTWLFILGNHDNKDKINTIINTVNKETNSNHKIVGEYAKILVKMTTPELNIKKQIILCHYPIEEWDSSHYGSIMLHGHTHGKKELHGGHKLSNLQNRLDVGLDNSIDHTPFTIKDVFDNLLCYNKTN